MARIPGGTFMMGTAREDVPRLQIELGGVSARLFEEEIPAHRVTVTTFLLDRHEVTNKEFQRWNGRSFPPGRERHPVANVTWSEAAAYCAWAGKRLPTEPEWEWAARGGLESPLFPWGNDPATPARANYHAAGVGTTTPVGTYPPNGYGLHDIAGNVWEWLADDWRRYSEAMPASGRKVIRGGSFAGVPVNLRVSYRDSHPPEDRREFIGFRCAR